MNLDSFPGMETRWENWKCVVLALLLHIISDTEQQGKFTDDGWLKTGDIVTISEDGCIEIKDRSKDVIKSGGEWISSVALENSLMGHPSVLEAAVIGIPDDKWMERPFAYVVLKEGKIFSAAELNEFLADKVCKILDSRWLPVIDAIPKTSVGKFLKSALREKFLRNTNDQTSTMKFFHFQQFINH